MQDNVNTILLTHVLSSETPVYAGGDGVKIKQVKSICGGDSCNQLHVSMSNHMGTHVDVPSHFVEGGKTITDYTLDDWIFNCCCLIDIPCKPGQIINADAIALSKPNYDCDLLIIRTGFESYRNEDRYWKQSPIFHKDLGDYFAGNFNNLAAIAFDCISLSSMINRNMGREAHREILGRNIRIFEDVKLSELPLCPSKVFSFPLWLDQADGAQVTMVAVMEEKMNGKG